VAEDCEPLLKLIRKAFLLGLNREDPAWTAAVNRAVFWIESSTNLFGQRDTPAKSYSRSDVFDLYTALPYTTKDIETFQNQLSPHDPRYFAIQVRARISGELRDSAARVLSNKGGWINHDNLLAIDGCLNSYIALTTPVPSYQEFINAIRNPALPTGNATIRHLTAQHPKLLETFVLQAMGGDVKTFALENLARAVFEIMETDVEIFLHHVVKYIPQEEWAGILTIAKDQNCWAYQVLGSILKEHLESPESCATVSKEN